MSIIGYILVFLGVIVIFSSIVGMYKFEDVYLKIHASSLSDSLGIPLFLLGVTCLQGDIVYAVKLIILIIVILIINPMSTYSIVNAIHISSKQDV